MSNDEYEDDTVEVETDDNDDADVESEDEVVEVEVEDSSNKVDWWGAPSAW